MSTQAKTIAVRLQGRYQELAATRTESPENRRQSGELLVAIYDKMEKAFACFQTYEGIVALRTTLGDTDRDEREYARGLRGMTEEMRDILWRYLAEHYREFAERERAKAMSRR